MSKKHYHLVKSFDYAIQGFKHAIKEEPNIKIHIAISFFAISAALLLNFSAIEWIILFLVIFIVIILELINTTLEALVDLITPDIRDKAKIAKDVSAAAVMFGAILSVIIGIFLFLPKIIALI